MLEKIIVILIVAAAVAGMAVTIRRQRRKQLCSNGCTSCPLAKDCNKKPNTDK